MSDVTLRLNLRSDGDKRLVARAFRTLADHYETAADKCKKDNEIAAAAMTLMDANFLRELGIQSLDSKNIRPAQRTRKEKLN